MASAGLINKNGELPLGNDRASIVARSRTLWQILRTFFGQRSEIGGCRYAGVGVTDTRGGKEADKIRNIKSSEDTKDTPLGIVATKTRNAAPKPGRRRGAGEAGGCAFIFDKRLIKVEHHAEIRTANKNGSILKVCTRAIETSGDIARFWSNLTIFIVYCPDSGKSAVQKKNFFQALTQALLEVPEDQRILIMGDIQCDPFGNNGPGKEALVKEWESISTRFVLQIASNRMKPPGERFTYKLGTVRSNIDHFLIRGTLKPEEWKSVVTADGQGWSDHAYCHLLDIRSRPKTGKRGATPGKGKGNRQRTKPASTGAQVHAKEACRVRDALREDEGKMRRFVQLATEELPKRYPCLYGECKQCAKLDGVCTIEPHGEFGRTIYEMATKAVKKEVKGGPGVGKGGAERQIQRKEDKQWEEIEAFVQLSKANGLEAIRELEKQVSRALKEELPPQEAKRRLEEFTSDFGDRCDAKEKGAKPIPKRVKRAIARMETRAAKARHDPKRKKSSRYINRKFTAKGIRLVVNGYRNKSAPDADGLAPAVEEISGIRETCASHSEADE